MIVITSILTLYKCSKTFMILINIKQVTTLKLKEGAMAQCAFFLAPTGAQGVKMCVRASGTLCSIWLYKSQTELKALREGLKRGSKEKV